MLIYSRKKTPPNSNHSQPAVDTSLNILNPPARALDVVHKLNAAHDEACEKFQKRLVDPCPIAFGINLCCIEKRRSSASTRKLAPKSEISIAPGTLLLTRLVILLYLYIVTHNLNVRRNP